MYEYEIRDCVTGCTVASFTIEADADEYAAWKNERGYVLAVVPVEAVAPW